MCGPTIFPAVMIWTEIQNKHIIVLFLDSHYEPLWARDLEFASVAKFLVVSLRDHPYPYPRRNLHMATQAERDSYSSKVTRQACNLLQASHLPLIRPTGRSLCPPFCFVWRTNDDADIVFSLPDFLPKRPLQTHAWEDSPPSTVTIEGRHLVVQKYWCLW